MTARRDDRSTSADAAFQALLERVARASDIPLQALSSMRALKPGELLLDGRFAIVRRLGRGATGTVYEAVDRAHDAPVALKLLRSADPVSVLRFKREFRSLADVVHPRLVRLHALFNWRGTWFFTMDLVLGRELGEYVAGLGTPGSSAQLRAREAWLRGSFPELCDGVAALHRAGKLHRDLKPSNVLVSETRQITIVDFGLVTAAPCSGEQRDHGSGTFAYLAPERKRGEGASEASDWYSIGVMLFEALTGHLPGADPSAALAQVAPDLAETCCALLAADPSARPTGAQLRSRFSAASAPAALLDAQLGEPNSIGREAEWLQLSAALQEVLAGTPMVCRVHGPSGFGKTTLLRAFARWACAEHGAEVLAGRCYESEHVPYKLIDGVIDALALQLGERVPASALALPPQQLTPLLRLFPALRGVAGLSQREEADGSHDSSERRRLAVAGLRVLLEAVARDRPLIVCIDDAQWADRDGAQLLAMVLESARPLLLVLCHRDADDNPSLAALYRDLERAGRKPCDVPVGELEPAALERLCRAACDAVPDALHELVREANGSPYFALELARSSRAQPQRMAAQGGESLHRSALDRLLQERIAALPADALDGLQFIALAGVPIERNLLRAAIPSHDLDRTLAMLCAGRLVRTLPGARAPALAVYHDRVCDVVVEVIHSTRRRQLQLQLAEAAVLHCPDELELIATHFAEAGELARAAPFARRAGRRAAAALAFERACEWFRLALRADDWPPQQAHSLMLELAQASALAGRAIEAAELYLRAAHDATTVEARSLLQLQAAAQWFCVGRLEQGESDLRRSLARERKPLPTNRQLAGFVRASAGGIVPLFRLYARRLPELLELGVLYGRYVLRGPAPISQDSAARCDAWYWVSLGRIGLDADDLSSYLVLRQLLEALRSGDAFCIARACHFSASMQSAHQSRFALSMAAFTEQLGRRAEGHCEDPRLAFFSEQRAAWQAHFAFDDVRAAQHADRAVQLARECHGIDRELTLLQLCLVPSSRGDLSGYSERLERFRREGERRRDDFSAGWSVALDQRWVFSSDHVGRLQSLAAARRRFEPRREALRDLAVYFEMSTADAERMAGALQSAYVRMERLIAKVRGTGIWVAARNRASILAAATRAALALAAQTAPGPGRRRLLLRAQTWSRDSPAPRTWSAAHRAALARQRGQLPRALAELEVAASQPGEYGVLLNLVARRTLGQLRGGAQGRALVHDSEELLAALVPGADPDYLTSCMLPGISLHER